LKAAVDPVAFFLPVWPLLSGHTGKSRLLELFDGFLLLKGYFCPAFEIDEFC